MTRKLRTVLFSSLYPSSARPGHGIFVETRLRQLLASGEIDTRVVAPVPWFPSTHPRFGAYAALAATPRREVRHGVEVTHPRYLLPPKIGMSVSPFLMALGALGTLRRLQAGGFDFDVIDAHYYYPDGVAAGLLAGWLGKPFTVTARGSDLNLIAGYAVPRRLMQWTARRAAASIGVCNALVDILRSWPVDEARLHVMRNGVELDRFRPTDRDDARRRLGLQGGPIVLSVGNLIELKGHHLVIDAMRELLAGHPQAHLVIVGKGPERARLESLAASLGLASKVTLAGAVDHASMPDWYGAADVMVLASSREGWANVLLESLACGTPVVATRVGGSPEVIADEVAGVLVDERDARSIAQAIRQLLDRLPARAAVRAYAEDFGWDSTTRAQLGLFRRLSEGRQEAAHA